VPLEFLNRAGNVAEAARSAGVLHFTGAKAALNLSLDLLKDSGIAGGIHIATNILAVVFETVAKGNWACCLFGSYKYFQVRLLKQDSIGEVDDFTVRSSAKQELSGGRDSRVVSNQTLDRKRGHCFAFCPALWTEARFTRRKRTGLVLRD